MGDWQHYPHATLGNGKDAMLYATLEPELTGTLEPLEKNLTGEADNPLRVLSTLPISTVPLDVIEGLPCLDFVSLDGLNDQLAILESGKDTLSNALVIALCVSKLPTHKSEMTYGDLECWADKNSFNIIPEAFWEVGKPFSKDSVFLINARADIYKYKDRAVKMLYIFLMF